MEKRQVGRHVVVESPAARRAGAIATLTLAFVKDPVMRFMYPDAESYFTHTPAIFDGYGGNAFDEGVALETEGLSAAALWFRPGAHGDIDAVTKVIEKSVAPDRLARTFALLEAMDSHHTEHPHWFLPLIGVDPAHQGKGLGGALLSAMTERLDRDGTVAYLDSTNILNVPLYERHGFEVIDEIRVEDAPPVWPMVRRPRRRG